MAQLLPGALARISRCGSLRGCVSGARAKTEWRRSCEAVAPAECPPPPSLPPPPPPCRRTASACPRAVRVLCCPPGPSRRPPCAPPPPPRPLSCRHHTPQNKPLKIAELQSKPHRQYDCTSQLDRVAQRLRAAENVRREEYEQEVGTRQPSVLPTSVAYSLAGERSCLHAADGRLYTVAHAVDAGSPAATDPARCGPCRTPPPPCPLRLTADDECQIRRTQHLDPCKHLPKVFVEIDRTKQSNGEVPDGISQTHTPNQSKLPESLTARIIEKFKVGSSRSCPRQVYEPQCEAGKARYAGDERWCKSPPSAVKVPSPCREPSLVERLRRRPGSSGEQRCNPRRNFHHSTSLSGCSVLNKNNKVKVQEETRKQVDKLDEILKERKNLPEAGQGRIIESNCENNKNLSAGNLELPVPASTDKVRVRVSLDFDNATSKNTPTKQFIEIGKNALCSGVKHDDSWLSLKNLQKKISRYRRNSKPNIRTEGSCPKPQKELSPPVAQSPCATSPFEYLPKRKGDPCKPTVGPTKFQVSDGGPIYNYL